jgi:nucleotide-binding universal stress UspA family protein
MFAVYRIVAGVNGSPGSVHALRQAAGLACHHDALLIPLLTWVPPEGDLAERKSPRLPRRALWEDDAWQRLWGALDTAFGGLPAGIRAQPAVLRGHPGRVLTDVADREGDLLIIGSGRQDPLRWLRCRVSRYCLANAHCPVLAIPPPALARETGNGLRGWAYRHRRIRASAGSLVRPIGSGSGISSATDVRRRS